MMIYNVEFFRPEEFRCPCCGAGRPSAMLVLFLDQLRKAFNSPIRVNSGFRCAKHNAEVGGAERSRHLLGCAADIAPLLPEGPDTEEWKTFLRNQLFNFKMMAKRIFGNDGWEVKEYKTFMHVAVPRGETDRLWNGEAILL